jgi:hypothetical protein
VDSPTSCSRASAGASSASDVKRANVLVAPYDGRPVPKIIDFGVAKATGERLIHACSSAPLLYRFALAAQSETKGRAELQRSRSYFFFSPSSLRHLAASSCLPVAS